MIRYDIPLDLHSEGYIPLEPLLPYDGPLAPEPVKRQPYRVFKYPAAKI